MKIVAFIGAGILIFFGAFMMIGATSAKANSPIGFLLIGILFIAVGLVIVFFAARRKPVAPTTNVTLNVDLPGNVAMDEIKCKSCGGVLSSKDIALVQGAPMVTCPYCHTVYQMTEEPKW